MTVTGDTRVPPSHSCLYSGARAAQKTARGRNMVYITSESAIVALGLGFQDLNQSPH